MMTLNDTELSDIQNQIVTIINKKVSPAQMWDRYNTSGVDFYKNISSPITMYYPSRMELQHLSIDDTENTICYQMRVTSDYSINTALARLYQVIRWVCNLNDIDIEPIDMNRLYDITPSLHDDVVFSDMRTHLYNQFATRYTNIDLVDVYEGIQSDIDMYLSTKLDYNKNVFVSQGYVFL